MRGTTGVTEDTFMLKILLSVMVQLDKEGDHTEMNKHHCDIGPRQSNRSADVLR